MKHYTTPTIKTVDIDNEPFLAGSNRMTSTPLGAEFRGGSRAARITEADGKSFDDWDDWE